MGFVDVVMFNPVLLSKDNPYETEEGCLSLTGVRKTTRYENIEVEYYDMNLVEKIAEKCKVDLIDAVQQPKADLSDYDRIGFASGIYFSKFHQTILKFASENLPENKKVFMICTYGGNTAYKSLEVILKEKKTDIIGKFGCKGYDTFGPFKLVGGIAKGHPDEKDLEAAVSFVVGLQ